jgi:hypothetical protein
LRKDRGDGEKVTVAVAAAIDSLTATAEATGKSTLFGWGNLNISILTGQSLSLSMYI